MFQAWRLQQLLADKGVTVHAAGLGLTPGGAPDRAARLEVSRRRHHHVKR
jgi:hypothetical protein